MSRLIAKKVQLIGTVFDAEEAAESELRIMFTLADIDELYVLSSFESLLPFLTFC